MQIFNTMTRKKEEFVPVHEGKVGIYACGPTVYNYFHIGNARPFIIFDTVSYTHLDVYKRQVLDSVRAHDACVGDHVVQTAVGVHGELHSGDAGGVITDLSLIHI